MALRTNSLKTIVEGTFPLYGGLMAGIEENERTKIITHLVLPMMCRTLFYVAAYNLIKQGNFDAIGDATFNPLPYFGAAVVRQLLPFQLGYFITSS